MVAVSQEFDTAGPLQVDAIPHAVKAAQDEAREVFMEDVEFTARDNFAGVIGGLINVAIARVMIGLEPREFDGDLADLINNNLGVGPVSLGYVIADLAEVMLQDPLDQIPTL